MCRYEYTAVFIDKAQLEGLVEFDSVRLQEEVKYMHMTMEFLPDSVRAEQFGTPVRLYIDGQGNNWINQGLHVGKIRVASHQIMRDFGDIEVPHITVSVAAGAKKKDTRYLDFKTFKSGVWIEGIYGGWSERLQLPVTSQEMVKMDLQ